MATNENLMWAILVLQIVGIGLIFGSLAEDKWKWTEVEGNGTLWYKLQDGHWCWQPGGDNGTEGNITSCEPKITRSRQEYVTKMLTSWGVILYLVPPSIYSSVVDHRRKGRRTCPECSALTAVVIALPLHAVSIAGLVVALVAFGMNYQEDEKYPDKWHLGISFYLLVAAGILSMVSFYIAVFGLFLHQWDSKSDNRTDGAEDQYEESSFQPQPPEHGHAGRKPLDDGYSRPHQDYTSQPPGGYYTQNSEEYSNRPLDGYYAQPAGFSTTYETTDFESKYGKYKFNY